ncbi:TIGR04086 family membrane protein [Alteribacillus sp. YIM 98480]|uniref:TIGR04086 family membrane protein n=1 Tax=Alteribacillus sp. YIM 98480 TaxID=2606599 RepID=UPI00131B6EC2|nr:TIGR04086 family membrane protein [Alteribacillus sp. YIM 98480]
MERSSRFNAIGAGMVVIIGLLIGCSIIFSVMLRFTAISEGSIQWLLFILALISFGIGGFISGLRAKEKGMFTGMLTAAGVLCIVILFQYLGYDSSLSGMQAVFFSSFLASSAIGGAIGVNAVSL